MGSECELSGFERGVLETLKRCQQRNENTLLWAMEVTKCIRSWGIGLPCAELGQVLVSHLCFDNNHSSLWKFMEQALSSGLIYPIQVLSLLTSRSSKPLLLYCPPSICTCFLISLLICDFRVLPHRRSQPKAYRLYLELLSRYALSFNPVMADACKEK
jgi:hypothetical protein